jgi:thymidylate synthase (FAD)
MKIVDASYEIIEEELSNLTIFERLERTGRVCYKSEGKIDEFSALPFCMKMIGNKHLATMEMAMVHLYVDFEEMSPETEKAIDMVKQAKYLIVTDEQKEKGCVYISGSIRAFIELYRTDWKEDFQSMYEALNKAYPEFFPHREVDQAGDADVEILHQDNMPYKHHCYAVRFIVNRAVTHEIVRHRPVTYLQESQRYCRYSDDKFGNEVTFINPKAFFVDDSVGYDYSVWKQSCEYAEKMYFKLLQNGQSPQAARTVLPNSCKTEIIVYTNVLEWEHIFSLRTALAAEPSMREVMIPLHQEMVEKGYLRQ